MAEVEEEQPRAAKAWRLIAGVSGSVFSGGIILATTFGGDPDNSLHSSGQAWAFAVFGSIILGTMGFKVVEAFRGGSGG